MTIVAVVIPVAVIVAVVVAAAAAVVRSWRSCMMQVYNSPCYWPVFWTMHIDFCSDEATFVV